VFTKRALLERALRSVLAQTTRDLEIVVVDDGLPDTQRILPGELARAHARLVRLEENAGAAAARNAGVRAARGEFVAFLDVDDEWLPEKLERQIGLMQRYGPRLSCTGFHMHRYGGGPDEVVRLHRDDGELGRLAFGCGLSPGSTLVASRACFERIGPFDESLARLEDWDWLLRAAPLERILTIAEPLSHVHAGPYPAAQQVRAALARFRSSRLRPLARSNLLYALRFLSALKLEEAAVEFREGHSWRALALGLVSFALYPFRNRAFFARNLVRAWQTVTQPGKGARDILRRGESARAVPPPGRRADREALGPVSAAAGRSGSRGAATTPSASATLEAQ
jgi:glycosyltransferase involved in cell wall biosynthesis